MSTFEMYFGTLKEKCSVEGGLCVCIFVYVYIWTTVIMRIQSVSGGMK